MKPLSVHIVSLGCPKNRVDTERLAAVLGREVTPATTPAEADLVLVATCAFIRPAVEESVQTILEAVEDIRESGRRVPLAVSGCLVSRYGADELAKEIPEVDAWMPVDGLDAWPGLAAGLIRGLAPGPFGPRPERAGSYAYLKVSEGCSRSCSFCTIPSIRGPHASVPLDAVEAEAKSLTDAGVKEIVLVGQDTTVYGRDLGLDLGLAELAARLVENPDLARLRIMYMYPSGLTDKMLEGLGRAGGKLAPYFDVPMQHAHPDILKSMGRPFTGDPMKAVTRIRAHFPDAALRTSLIVGYPGESEQAFAMLKDFVAQARFHHLGVFPYWPEDGTPAASLPGQVPDEVKQARLEEIMAMQAEISEDILEGYVGTVQTIVVDEPDPGWPGLHRGRTAFQAPEVDGVTYVSGPGVKPGALVNAEIVQSTAYDLSALA